MLIKRIKASLLRFFTKKKSGNYEIKDVKKILFLRYYRIGDMIISTPVFRELKQNYPNIEITVLASKTNQSIVVNNPYIDNIYINQKNNLISDFLTLIKLRKINFDACVEFDHSVVPHAILRLNIIKPKIIISVKKTGRYGVLGHELKLYNYFTEKKNNLHSREIWLQTLSPFGIRPYSKDYDLLCTDEQTLKANNYCRLFNRNKILIGVNLEGAANGKKIRFSELNKICQGLYSFERSIQIIILTAPINFNSTVRKVKTMNLNYVKVSYKTDSIMDAAALIKKLDLIISPDTSIAHIASTFNKPIITIHENNLDSYKLFAPTSEINRTIFSKSKKSLDGFSIQELLDYGQELISLIKK